MLALATDTPDFMRARNATDILSQVGVAPSYTLIHPHTPSRLHSQPRWGRVRVLIGGLRLPQTKYKHNAEMDRATYTTVIDTPDILHAQQMKNIVSQVDPVQPSKTCTG